MTSEQEYAVLVVGGGPAGMSAALAASKAGLRTLLVDERPTLGGQIFKQPGPGFTVTDRAALGRQWRFGRALIDRAEAAGFDIADRTAVVDIEPVPGGWSVMLLDDAGTRAVTVERLVIAPGAHDRPVVFPGWTLPGVITAGGLQTLAKTQRIMPGRRMVFAGSGPVALAFPAQLAGYGANIVLALEAGPAPRPADLVRIAGAAAGNVGLLRDAALYRGALVRHRVSLRYGRMVVRAEGHRRVERVVHAAVDRNWRVVPGTEQSVDADLLCLGYGFVPSPELFRLLGCALGDDESLGGSVVEKDTWGRTSVVGVYAAGDGTGVEGSFVAIDEGTAAGLATAVDAGALTPDEAERRSAGARRRLARRRRLAVATSGMYRVGQGVFELAEDDTVVCRCEEVRFGTLREAVAVTADISVVKAATRAGMGPCQGRNCGRHIAAMIAREHGVPMSDIAPATARMPVRPVPISALADHQVADPGLFTPPDDPGGTA